MNMENPHPQAQEIVEALSSADSETIRDAAFKAGDLGLEEAVPQLCELIKSPSVGVQEAAEYALRKIRGPQVVGALLPLLRSDEAPVRNVAMDILREIGVDSIESMQPYLMDEDPDLRIFITDILGYCRTHQASLLLGRALLKDPEVNVRYQAAVSLGNLAFPEAVGGSSNCCPRLRPWSVRPLWTPWAIWATSSPFPCCSARWKTSACPFGTKSSKP